MSALANAIRDAIGALSPTDERIWSPRNIDGAAGVFDNYQTSTGEAVNERTALLVSAHFACVRCKSEDLSVLPFEVFEDVDGEREQRKDNPVYALLNREMNPEMSAMIGKSTLLAHAVGFKKGVAEIVRDGRGNPVEIWPLDPTRVNKVRKSGRIWHEVTRDDGVKTYLPDADVLEIIGPSYDGRIGYSMADLSRYVLGLALAAQKFQGSFFGQGSWLGGMIEELPKGMTPKQIVELRESFEQRHRGAGKAFGIGIIPGGAKFKEVGIDPQRGQVRESLDYTVTDICRFHRVPPHKVQDYTNAHYNNVEQGEIAYRGDALLPLGTAFEQEIERKLLPVNYRARINYNALQRVDFKTQMDGLAVGRMWGLYSIDDALRKLGENPIDGPHGGMRLIPANMIPVERAYEQRTQQSTNAKDPQGEPGPSKGNAREAFLPLVVDGLNRAYAKEEKAVEQKRKNGHEAAVNAFYDEHRAYVADCVMPTICSMAHMVGGLAANDERLRVLGELHAVEYVQTRPAVGKLGETWLTEFGARWIDAALALCAPGKDDDAH